MRKNLRNQVIKKRPSAKIYFSSKGIKLFQLIDKFLSFFYSLRKSASNTHENISNCKKMVILHSHLIGDVIMSIPAWKAIRKRYPDSKLIYWGNSWGKELLFEQEIFDDFVISKIPWSTYDYSFSTLRKLFADARKLRKREIDLAIDFRGDIRNIFLLHLLNAKRTVSYDFTGGKYWLTDIVPSPQSYHIIDRDLNVASSLGAKVTESIPKLQLSPKKRRDAKGYFYEKGLKNIVFLHSGASQPKRLWPSERFAKVIDYLHGKGYSPVLLSGPSDKTVVEAISDKCKLSPHILSIALKDIPAFLSCAEFFIGTDSGIVHIAAALGKNVIMLFGSQLPTISSARGDGMIQIIIRGDFECRPCPKAICDRNNACMRAIQVEDVIEAINKIEGL